MLDAVIGGGLRCWGTRPLLIATYGKISVERNCVAIGRAWGLPNQATRRWRQNPRLNPRLLTSRF